MNERQFLLAIRNVVRLEDLSAETAAKILPQLRQAFDDVTRLIDALPPEDIMRQMRYKQMQQRIASIFVGVNEQFKNELTATLRGEVERQAYFAQQYLNAAELSPAQRAAAAAPSVGVGTVPVAQPSVSITETARGFTASLGDVPPTFGPGNFQLGGQITRTQLMALADETQVLGKRFDKLFAVDGRGISPWIQSNIDRIDRVVKAGFLTGQSNEEIAAGLRQFSSRSSRLTKTQSEAIARTAVMDMSQRAQARFYDANRDRIYAYEYDATFDYRVCEECAPWSGAIRRKRSELPETPRHPNCRCQRLPLTRTEWELRKEEAPGNASFVDLVPGERKVYGSDGKPVIGPNGKHTYRKVDRPKEKKGEKYYARPVYVGGKRYWRKRVDVPAAANRQDQMAEFLRNASRETQAEVMGGERAARFRGLLKEEDRNGEKRFTAQQALLRVLPRRG